MSSPVVADDIPIIDLSADTCAQFKAMFAANNKFREWLTWAFDENGDPTTDFIGSLGQLLDPVGTIKFWASPSVPGGFLICNGQEVSKTVFPALYAVWGDQWGSSPFTPPLNANNFRLPDLQDRVPVGVSATLSLGDTGGEKTHALTADENGTHTHGLDVPGISYDAAGTGDLDAGDGGNLFVLEFQGIGAETLQDSGLSTPHQNMQPYFVGYWIVRY